MLKLINFQTKVQEFFIFLSVVLDIFSGKLNNRLHHRLKHLSELCLVLMCLQIMCDSSLAQLRLEVLKLLMLQLVILLFLHSISLVFIYN